MGHLSRSSSTAIDLVRARPRPELLLQQPPTRVGSVLAVDGEDYCIYLADEREQDEPGAGEAINGAITVDLPAAKFLVSCYSPVTGLYSPAITISGKEETRILLPEFHHDIVVRIRRED